MSKLFKGESVLLDSDGFVYIRTLPEKPKPDLPPEPGPEPEPEPGPDLQAILQARLEQERMEMEMAAQKARSIVEGANRYLMKVHEDAQKQADEIFDNARKEGYQQGYEEGFSRALAENEQALSRIVSLLERIDRDKEAIFKEHEQEIVDLALDVARKVVGEHLAKDDQAFLNIFKNATEAFRGQKNVRLIISQHEARFATASSKYLLSLLHGVESLDIQVLDNAQPGTCILETDDVLIEASAQGQLDKLTGAVDAIR